MGKLCVRRWETADWKMGHRLQRFPVQPISGAGGRKAMEEDSYDLLISEHGVEGSRNSPEIF